MRGGEEEGDGMRRKGNERRFVSMRDVLNLFIPLLSTFSEVFPRHHTSIEI